MLDIRIPISEIFASLSGEGLSTGTPSIFVRTAGCNFSEDPMGRHNCAYCDTAYALYKEQGKEKTIVEIANEVKACAGMSGYGIKDVILTGGDPLWHNNIKELVDYLILMGFDVEIITNGSLPLWNNFKGIWSMDLKTPCSGNESYNLFKNLKLLRAKDSVKFVVAGQKDFDYVENILTHYVTKANIIIQPSWKKIEVSVVADWVIKFKQTYGIKVRLGTQVHKFIWGEKRGV